MKTIWIIEDDKDIASICFDVLGAPGRRFFMFEDAMSASQSGVDPDLIIVDVSALSCGAMNLHSAWSPVVNLLSRHAVPVLIISGFPPSVIEEVKGDILYRLPDAIVECASLFDEDGLRTLVSKYV